MLRRFFLVILALWAIGAGLARAGETGALKLLPLANRAVLLSEALRSAVSLADLILFERQSFDVYEDGRRVGSLLSGQGKMIVPGGNGRAVCFVAFVASGGVRAINTIGVDDWEAETCLSVNAIGVVSVESGAGRVAFVFEAAAPHEVVLEPVVMILPEVAENPLAIDLAATKLASLAGATTIKAVQGALRKPSR